MSYQRERPGSPVTVWLECYSAAAEAPLAQPYSVTLQVEGYVDEEAINFPLYEFKATDVFRFDWHSHSPNEFVQVNSLEELEYLEGVLLMMDAALDETQDHV